MKFNGVKTLWFEFSFTAKIAFIHVILVTILNQIFKFNNLTVLFLLGVFIFIDNILKDRTIVLLILSIFTPGFLFKTIFLIYCIIRIFIKTIIKNKGELNRVFKSKDSNIKLFLSLYLFMFLSFGINQLFNFNMNIISFLLIVATFIIPTVSYFVFTVSDVEGNFNEMKNTYCYAAIAQVFPILLTLVIQIVNGRIALGDAMSGTLGDANLLSITIIISMLIIYFDAQFTVGSKLRYSIIYMSILAITDAKHIYALAIISIIFYMIIFSSTTKNKIKNMANNKKVVASLLFVIIIGGIFCWRYTEKYIKQNNLIIYVNDKRVNLKWSAFKYTFTNINFPRNIIGIGPGNFGSRAANAMAKDTMYKGGSEVKLPSFIKGYTNPLYEPIARRYTKEYYDNISYFSAILSYPFNSIITIYGEVGIIGLVFLLLFIIVNIKAAAENDRKNPQVGIGAVTIITITMTLLLLFFDNYLEKAELMISVLMVLSFNMSLFSKKERLS